MDYIYDNGFKTRFIFIPPGCFLSNLAFIFLWLFMVSIPLLVKSNTLPCGGVVGFVMLILILGTSAGEPDLDINSGDCGDITIGDRLLGRRVGVRACV